MPACAISDKQPDGLERYGLAAGVGAGDHQRGEFIAHPDRGRHHLFRINQRMPRLNQANLPAFIQLRRHGAHTSAQRRAGENHVRSRERMVRLLCVKRRIRRDAGGEIGENALDFVALLERPLLQLVAGFDHGRSVR